MKIGSPESIKASAALDALSDLQQNTPDQVKRLRSHERVDIRSRVIAQPGNSSQRHEFKLQGVSGDISAGGCLILFPLPLQVGDVYWLSFDRQVLRLDPMFARCIRCRLVKEDAYEVGFRFFSPLDLQQLLQPAASAAGEGGLFD